MDRELTPEEKLQIEREFVARQEAAAKRRSFLRAVFLIGISAGAISALTRVFFGAGITLLFLRIVWIGCITLYIGGRIFPRTLWQDMDLRWQLNPWQEALQNLSEGCREFEAVTLLVGPPVIQLISTFIYFSFK